MYIAEHLFILGETHDRNRCTTALNYIVKNRSRNFYIYLMAGIQPGTSHKRFLGVSMKEFIQDQLHFYGFSTDSNSCVKGNQKVTFVIGTNPNCWGTLEEILELIHYFEKSHFPAILTLVSGTTHLPRIKTAWNLFRPKQKINTLPADEAWTTKTAILERIKTLEAVFFYLIYRIFDEKTLKKVSDFKNRTLNTYVFR